MSAAGEFKPRELGGPLPVFSKFLPPSSTVAAGRAGKLVDFTMADLGIRFFVPRNDGGFGWRIFHMLTAEYPNAVNDNGRAPGFSAEVLDRAAMDDPAARYYLILHHDAPDETWCVIRCDYLSDAQVVLRRSRDRDVARAFLAEHWEAPHLAPVPA